MMKLKMLLVSFALWIARNPEAFAQVVLLIGIVLVFYFGL